MPKRNKNKRIFFLLKWHGKVVEVGWTCHDGWILRSFYIFVSLCCTLHPKHFSEQGSSERTCYRSAWSPQNFEMQRRLQPEMVSWKQNSDSWKAPKVLKQQRECLDSAKSPRRWIDIFIFYGFKYQTHVTTGTRILQGQDLRKAKWRRKKPKLPWNWWKQTFLQYSTAPNLFFIPQNFPFSPTVFLHPLLAHWGCMESSTLLQLGSPNWLRNLPPPHRKVPLFAENLGAPQGLSLNLKGTPEDFPGNFRG